jgi:hypothetical protein
MHGVNRGKKHRALPAGTRIQQVSEGLTVENVAVVLRFNAPGLGDPRDPSAEALATYTLSLAPPVGSSGNNSGGDGVAEETWDEAAEDVHCPNNWLILNDAAAPRGVGRRVVDAQAESTRGVRLAATVAAWTSGRW